MPPNLLQEALSEPEEQQAQPPPGTSNEEPVVKEETPGTKRKHDEISRMQAFHCQPVVDAARAVNMDDINFNAPFSGFNFAANPGHTRFEHYHYSAFHPPKHSANGGSDFFNESIYNNTMSEPPNYAQSLSGNVVLPESFVPGSFGNLPHQDDDETFFRGSFDAVELTYMNGANLFSSSSYGNAEPSHVSSTKTFVPGHFGTELTYSTGNNTFTPTPFAAIPNNVDGHEDCDHDHDIRDEDFKQEDTQESYRVSAAPAADSDFAASESEDERPRKTPKLNKDGGLRKPRQPRPKLLKWSDDDWKNVCLGIVWACGETGVQIPFDQAAQVVGERCTAGALQQALLKLRGKQVDAGHSIPNLKMAWTRKNKPGTPTKMESSVEPEANKTSRRKPTRFEATQSLIVTLPRAYTDKGREGLQAPYKWKKSPKKNKSANVKSEQTGYLHGQGTDHLPFTPTRGLYQSPPETPFGGNNVGYLQGMVLGGGEYTNLLTNEGLQEVGMSWGDAADDVFGL
ncbi:hypothetical protein N0V91_007021 [Didymella pomorum]|jgi:hypothetical protein|uniref:Uncharacterized protein n=1 Tax=Didymella pomorum TaxID=749634 RepID=A0A9W9D6Y1_9PLEO|nr:hypothetical protein N0V91_007021 [Didymella pomorum]